MIAWTWFDEITQHIITLKKKYIKSVFLLFSIFLCWIWINSSNDINCWLAYIQYSLVIIVDSDCHNDQQYASLLSNSITFCCNESTNITAEVKCWVLRNSNFDSSTMYNPTHQIFFHFQRMNHLHFFSSYSVFYARLNSGKKTDVRQER